ncbi:ComEC/Rec2 family competence protein [Candidatus Falkowbacteria bacterium]|nr:ComEC/Rec2 family competence protein [Candidatus Falkowbacteria bacterium]
MFRQQFGQIEPTPANLLLSASLVFVVGIAVFSYLPDWLASNEAIWLGVMSVVGVLASWLWARARCRYALAALFLLAFAGWRYSLTFPAGSEQSIWRYNEKRVVLTGTIGDEPVFSQKDQRLLIEVSYLLEPENKMVDGRVLAVTNLNPAFAYGNRVKLSCMLQTPRPIEDFAYDRYLAKDGVYSVCYQPLISVVGRSETSWLQRLRIQVFAVKDWARRQIGRALPEPQASLVKGMILGDQRGISREVQSDFSRSGLSHIVAISGMNMTILAALFVEFFLLAGLSRRPAVVIAGAALWLYTLLIGWPASAVRAVILSSLYLLAVFAGRLADLPRALALAAATMLLASPRMLRDDLGFSLSFLAFLGVAYFVPLFDRISWWPKSFLPKVRELIWLTLSAQILVWPLLAVTFGQVSLIAPLANLLVVWTLPLIMLIALVGLPLAAFWLPLGQGLLLLTGWLAGFDAAVARLMARPDWAVTNVSGLSGSAILSYYMFVAWLLFRLRKRMSAESENIL